MKHKIVKKCMCGRKFIIFKGNTGRLQKLRIDLPIRQSNAINCSKECSKKYSCNKKRPKLL